MQNKRIISLVAIFSLICGQAGLTHADDFMPSDEEENFSKEYTIDSGDKAGAGEQITLNFGESLGKYFRFDIDTNQFELNDNLFFESNEIKDVRIDNLSSAPSCSGASDEGRVYYNTTDNNTYVCNGTSFEQINGGSGGVVTEDLAIVQARRTSSFTISSSFTDVTFDATDIENDTAVVEHDDTNTDRIQINEDGFYLISYDFSADNPSGSTQATDVSARVRLNDSSTMNGSESETHVLNTRIYLVEQELSQSFYANLSDGDFITLQLDRGGTSTTAIAGGIFTAVKMEGVQGPEGPPGSGGGDPTGTSSESFVLDNDNTGGNLTLQFGDTLAKTLTWDNANTRFAFNDDLRVGGNLEATGTQFTLDSDNTGTGANVSIIAEQGSDNNGELRYNATSNRWEVSNDGGTFQPIGVTKVFDAYDAAGNTSVTTTETTLNIDTVRINDADTYTLSSDEVTFNRDGLYRITGRLTVDSVNTSGAQRSSSILRVEENTGAGFGDVPGASCQDYMREQSSGISSTSCTVTYLGSYDSGDIIRLTHDMSGSTTGETVPEGSSLTIELIREE